MSPTETQSNYIKIVLPEGDNPNIIEAARRAKQDKLCEPMLLRGDNTLQKAAEMLSAGKVDGMVAGIDHTTRDVILTTRDCVGLLDGNKTFGSLFVFEFPDGRSLIMADGGVTKNPSSEQLADIVIFTHDAARPILDDTPRVAMLSFSTLGSGGRDDSITKIQETISIVKERRPDIIIDGEMQLDAAVNALIGQKKAPDSPVAGRANILITPDLNSGNILYKSIEQFGGAHAYGPVLLGFKKPVSDLSRGSTTDDVYGCLKIIAAQVKEAKK
ncbi:phosphate acyltransferase [Candidatus Saccharibacteria bacterium]|nr:phosphate acyltransferase [Candidatus Saccharibacteria bacterium]